MFFEHFGRLLSFQIFYHQFYIFKNPLSEPFVKLNTSNAIVVQVQKSITKPKLGIFNLSYLTFILIIYHNLEWLP